jgi:hypothetical protein
MAEPTDELALVQCISGLFHTHSDHLCVVFEQTVFGYFDIKRRGVGMVSPERVFV